MNQRFLDVLLSNSTHAGTLTNFYSFAPLSYLWWGGGGGGGGVGGIL